MKINKKNLLRVLYICMALLFVIFIFNKKDKDMKNTDNVKIENIVMVDESLNSKEISLAGRIQSLEQTNVSAELSAKITNIFVGEGDSIKKGTALFQLENINQRLAVQNAKVSVNSAKNALKKMQNNNNLSDKDSVLSHIVGQQDSFIKSAKNSYINVDLRAYPEDYDESASAPTISGNYNCEIEGEYIIEVYGSASDSGASIRIEGLETGRSSVTTDYANALGSCGLEIIFSKGFKKNKTWIIPVPNIRSGAYKAAKNKYDSDLSNKNLLIKTSTVLPEDISAAKDQLAQAQLRLESAYIQLAKTKVKAPFDGTITKIFTEKGSLASAYVPLLEMTSPGWEIETNISSHYSFQFAIGDQAVILVDDKKYSIEIKSIVQQSSNSGQKIPLIFSFIDEVPENIFDEMFVSIVLPVKQNSTMFVKSDFVGFGYYGPFVNCNGRETLGLIVNENSNGYWVDLHGESCEKIELPDLVTAHYE